MSYSPNELSILRAIENMSVERYRDNLDRYGLDPVRKESRLKKTLFKVGVTTAILGTLYGIGKYEPLRAPEPVIPDLPIVYEGGGGYSRDPFQRFQ